MKEGDSLKKLKIVKNTYSLLTICLIVVGLVLLVFPQVALSVMCKIIGIFLIVYGIVKLTGYFSKDIFQLAYQFDFGLGIVSLILGTIMLVKTGRIIDILSVVVGIFIIVDAALRIQTAVEAKKFGLEKWWLILIMSLAVAVLGVLLMALPYQTTGFVVRLIGLNLILDGVMNLFIVQNAVHTIIKNREWENGI